jgi:hypothetical protein
MCGTWSGFCPKVCFGTSIVEPSHCDIIMLFNE